jgi:hypothetical protein
LKIFVKNNKLIITIQYLYFIGLWTYATILPLILNKHFDFSTAELSLFQNIYILFMAIGFAFASIYIGKKASYIKMFSNSIFLLPILMILNYLCIHFDINHLCLFFIRSLEGLSTGIFLSVISFIIRLELLDYQKNGQINSYMFSLGYLIKFLVPIISINYFATKGHEENIFIYATIFYSIMTLILFKYKRLLFYKYQSKISRHNKDKKSLKFMDSLKFNFLFFKKSEYFSLKMFFLSILFSRNSLRPFFDLYLGLFLINTTDKSLTEITFLVSLIIIGQSSQIFTGKLSDKINLYYFNLIQLIGSIIVYILLINIDSFNGLVIYIIFYLFGFFRSMYANYDYKAINYIIEKGNFQINQINFVNNVYGEFIHYLSYLIYGTLLIFISIKSLIYVPLFIFFISIYFLYNFDYKIFYSKRLQ